MVKAVVMLMALQAVLVIVGATSAGRAPAVCDPSQLAVCKPAVINRTAPTASCCSNLRAQETCFCWYARNPAYKSYITSPNAGRTLASCDIPAFECP